LAKLSDLPDLCYCAAASSSSSSQPTNFHESKRPAGDSSIVPHLPAPSNVLPLGDQTAAGSVSLPAESKHRTKVFICTHQPLLTEQTAELWTVVVFDPLSGKLRGSTFQFQTASKAKLEEFRWTNLRWLLELYTGNSTCSLSEKCALSTVTDIERDCWWRFEPDEYDAQEEELPAVSEDQMWLEMRAIGIEKLWSDSRCR